MKSTIILSMIFALAFSATAMAFSSFGFAYSDYPGYYDTGYYGSYDYYYPTYYDAGYYGGYGYDYYPAYYVGGYYDYEYDCYDCGGYYQQAYSSPTVYTYTNTYQQPQQQVSCSSKCNGNTLYYNGYYDGSSCQYSAMDCSASNSEESRYCSGNNVYARERVYSCMNSGCQYSIQTRLVQSCQNGCANGACTFCSDATCGSSSGFIGQKFCSGNDVVQKYRNYYCSGNGCSYTDSQRTVETCSNGCSNGVCGTCESRCSGNVYYYNGAGYGSQCSYVSQNCDELDREVGPRFCKDGNAYTKYRNYYCSGGCNYVLEDRLVEKCYGDCNNGYCASTYVAQGNCASLTGYYGDTYCKNSNVYKIYRNYYSSGNICQYTQTENIIQHCQGPCIDGSCRESCQLNCSQMNGWYCTGFGRELRTYECDHNEVCRYTVSSTESIPAERSVCVGNEKRTISSQCTNGIIKETVTNIEVCAGGCTNGMCIGTSYCDSNDGFIGTRYCSGSNLVQKYRDYYSASSGCAYTDSEKTIEVCSGSCTNGICSGQQNNCIKDCSASTTLNFAVDVFSLVKVEEFSLDRQIVFSGLLQGEKGIEINVPESYLHNLTFTTANTNNYGDIMVFLGNDIIYRSINSTIHNIELNRHVGPSVIKIIPESSFWKVWAPTTYDVMNARLRYDAREIMKNSYEFEISEDGFDSFARGDVVQWPANTSIKLNGKYLDGASFGKDKIFIGNNVLEILPVENTRSDSRIIVKLVYTNYCSC